MILRLPQSKLYLKILDILYLIEDTNISITSEVVKKVLQSMHIFNNMTFTFKSRIIKTSSKLDMAIVWINIWNAQSSVKIKFLINRCFNIERYCYSTEY